MASKADVWRRRIAERLENLPAGTDPKSPLLASLIGPGSAELDAALDRPSRDAAVLLGLIERDGHPGILLTERAAHLAHHAGQISFPGGRLEHDETHIAAALREAHEEVLLLPDQVEVLGVLPPRLTGTGFAITPVIGWLAPAFRPSPDPGEVAAAFEVPVAHLLDPAHRAEPTRERYGARFRSCEFSYGRYRIWGATAAILAEFLEVIDAKTI